MILHVCAYMAQDSRLASPTNPTNSLWRPGWCSPSRFSSWRIWSLYFPFGVYFFSYCLFRGAGTGGLGLAMEGPSEAKMSCTDNKDGSCSVEYIPYEPGTYNLNITYGGKPVTGKNFSFLLKIKKCLQYVTCFFFCLFL